MKFSPVRFAFAALASLAMMGTSADAATIFIYGQQNNTDVVTSTSTGGTTTFSTGPGVAATPINIDATNIGGISPPTKVILPETFSFTSSAAVTGSAGNLTQTGFSGSFSFGNQVIGTVTNGTLSVTTGSNGTSGSFISNQVSFTQLGAAILAQLGISGIVPGLGGTISISLINVQPTTPASLNFTAQNSGLITASVPEPASVVMTSMALVAGLGCFGLRRAKASQA